MAHDGRLTRYQKLFDEKSKADAFEKVAEQFYAGNFGRMTKADFETLLFHLYIEQCLKKGLPYDDYVLSKDLGIVQSRVRSLKVKKELLYPHEGFDWKGAFINCIPNSRYDKVKHLVKVHIPDVNVLIELRNHMECHGWYDEYQLNPKLFQCRADIFIALCGSLEEGMSFTLDPKVKGALEKLKKESMAENEQSALGKILSGSMEDGVKNLAISASKEVLLNVLKILPFGGLAGEAIKAFITIVEKS